MENATNNTKFCSTCGKEIAAKAVICPHCGCQTEMFAQTQAQAQPQIVINNSNQNQVNGGMPYGRAKSKWVALLLWFFLGYVGAHKFYEGKIFMGLVYIFTVGLFGIGYVIDFFALLFKPNPYYV